MAASSSSSTTTTTTTVTLLTFLSLLSLAAAQAQSPLPPSPPPPSKSLLTAVDTLSNSGYTAMSMTLKLLVEQPPEYLSLPPSLTIFAPQDSAFATSGQPSLSLLLHHFSPLSISLDSLISLPYASTIPTLSKTPTPLFITTPSSDPAKISVNNVNISGSPLYDDGYVVIFAVEKFFEPNFSLPGPGSTPDFECARFTSFSRYLEPSGVLKSRGYSIMATFLDLQLNGFVGSGEEMKLTIFAPTDEALIGESGNFLDYPGIFLRHLLPCKLSWVQLNNGIVNETVFKNYVEELSMKITRSDGSVMVNGVRIMAPDMYENEWLAIHGVRELIPVFDASEEKDFEEISMVKFVKKVENECPVPPDRSEF